VIDVSGLLVTPALIDAHLHLMNGLGALGTDRCTRFEQTGSMRRRRWTGHEHCRDNQRLVRRVVVPNSEPRTPRMISLPT
jgi:predicted amidohydrolase YtcJ